MAQEITSKKVSPIQDATMESKPLPTPKSKQKKIPEVASPENSVMIGGKMIEIKPTKVKYQRNRVAVFYRAIEFQPLMDVQACPVGVYDEERDGDKCVMDWLISVFDDETLVTDNYDEMDTELIERILAIFKRVNKINEKEEAIKNAQESQRAVV